MRNQSIVMFGCAAAVMSFTTFAQAQITQLSSAKLTYTINGGVPVSISLDSQPVAGGKLKYTGSAVTPELLELSVVYVVDGESDPISSANGQFKCVNNSGESHGIEAVLEFPLCPAIKGGTMLGGNVTMFVVANAGGGGVTCLPGANCVWQARVGDNAAHSLFWCPYQMGTTGAGTMQSNAVFGAPVPGLVGPSDASSIGSSNRFTITAGESLTVTSNLIVKSLSASSGCLADVNRDGNVDGADLVELIGNWGAPDGCAAEDLNGDGLIDGGDMAIILGSWGGCDS